ncbi:MAG: UDP-glucose 4-epimerase GalE [Saprospiraceae bacterium]|nr:UDP-glucose 4-epimerase GalE [Saprospiraceae bacterium]
MKKKKILVTGGTGYIGSHTIVELIEAGYDVVCADNCINSDESSLQGIHELTGVKIPFYRVDLCDREHSECIFTDHPDLSGIIHFAALKAVGESVEKPVLYFRNNLNSLLNMLEMCLKYNISSFIFSSSCTVYGDTETCPVDEQTPLKEAASPYGRTKQMGEEMICDCLANSKTQSILLRYFNPAGAHASGLLGESPMNAPQNLVPAITEAAIGKRQELTVFGTDYPTRDGSCVRDYIHVSDLARAHVLALNYLLSGKQAEAVDIYNLGIGQGLSVLEIIQAFEQVTGVKLPYRMGDRRPGDVVAIYSDYSKASKNLKWKPNFGVEDIMRTAWTWEQNRSMKTKSY